MSFLFRLLPISSLSFLIPSALAFNRTAGPPQDHRFAAASRACNGSNPANFQFQRCSVLIACVYNKLDEAFKASLGSGTNIASLLPTILVLIGSPTRELIELAFLSPHRAIAVCCFGIGLPSGLFRQLRPLPLQSFNFDDLDLRVREWTIFLPSISHRQWQHLAAKLVVDSTIIALVSIMFWRNLVVTSFTMVPWRCEYTWLLPAWPLACISWLLAAFILLHFMKESIRIYNPADPRTQYSLLALMSLPYTVTSRQHSHLALPPSSSSFSYGSGEEMDTMPTSHSGAIPNRYQPVSRSHIGEPQRHALSPSAGGLMRRSSTALLAESSNCVTVRIVMPSSFGFRSWRCYETMIETTAVGIYLYATFVLTSLLFLNADGAIG
ncbi:hypothetical protein MMC29_007656, partial [Sticta canariensis]|nr:hypothetical protein [Sticta canariensis]